jgi:hypothetical protein
MKTLFTSIFLSVLFLTTSDLGAQSSTKNTSYATNCGCPGEVWDTSTPFSPSITFSATGFSKRVMFSDYKFNIPATATITGIEASFAYTMGNTPVNSLRDTLVTLMHPSAFFVQDKCQETGYINPSNSPLTFGTSTDKWQSYWAPADINSPAFGLTFKVFATTLPTTFVFTNGATITVHYEGVNGIKESQRSSAGISAFVSDRKLHIQTQHNEEAIVEIFALTGRKILSVSLAKSSDQTVDLHTLPKGVYLYAIQTTSGRKTSKFLLEE